MQIATTVNDLADKLSVSGLAKLPVEEWKKEQAAKPSAKPKGTTKPKGTGKPQGKK